MERLIVIRNVYQTPQTKPARRINRRATLAEANAKLTHHRIAYNADWREYRVRPTAPTLSPAAREAQTYHTDDINDAILTAQHMDILTAAREAR